MNTNVSNYIVTWSDDDYEVHGPFENTDRIAAYGLWWQANCGDGSGDDPRWTSSYIADPRVAPHIDEPSDDLWPVARAHYYALEAEMERVRKQEAREAGLVLPPVWLIVRGEAKEPGPKANYLLLLDDGFSLFGPIPSRPDDAVSVWGKWWETQHDNWNWQSVYLANPKAPPRVVMPKPELWFGDTYAGYSASEYGK
jgi:hypothetical protein